MLLFLVKNVLISVVIIFFLHYIYGYFKSSLTTPKIKDLVNKPQIQYDEIISVIKKKVQQKPTENSTENSAENSAENRIKNDMKNELKKYMNQLNDNSEENIPIANINSELYESFSKSS
jgi:hypothetical protein